MDRSRWLSLAFFSLGLMLATHWGQALARRAHEKDLLEELQEVLEKLQHKAVSSASWEKKLNLVPQCSLGGPCAVRKGPRIGKLCDCPAGAACKALLLKCL
ncbi:cocaine- and amphetamine-regulated transcript protein-like [Anolis sagrei]|uniref:cocaine- and amphetamine-regulated transcript protein-like n=1 Tax=Anolis sagrei TaxID=38937 RepID=UPI00352009C7